MISMKSGGMKFPVDLLANVGLEELEESAHNYMNNLLYSSPDSPEHLTVSDSTQVTINISSVGFIPLYGFNDKQKILALFSPSDPFIAVALYLLDQWWTVDDILKTADAARDGALEVKTVGERIVLYILNRVIYRAKEMSSEELPFLCHREKDYAKILWSNGEAVGFYSVKPSGSLCNSFSTRTYQLPVMDSTYVRKCQRGKGFGLQMLEDFVLSFKEDCLGLRYPLTKSMYKVCEKYLCQYPGDIDLLWEVESIGAPNQRTNIASKIQAMDLGAVSKSLSFTEESLVITEVTEKTAERETLTTQTKEAGSMECTVEIVEEVTVLRATKVSEAEDVAVALRGRSSGSKRRNISEKPQENKSEKVCIKDTVIRIEDIEPETPRQQQVSVHVSELEQTEGMFSVAAEEKGEDVVHTIPEDESVMLDKPATVPLSQDLKEADVIAALMTEVPQVEDDVIQVMKNDSQVIVENVASEIEEAEEECQKEDTEVLVSSEKPLEVHKKAETLDKVGEGTEIKISDEKSEEVITQHELSLSTHTTSEDVEAERTVKTVVEVIKLVQNETHRQSSQQHSKSQDTAQDKGRILRRRTVSNTPTPKRKYTRHSQNICEELEKEVDEEENNGSTEVVEELAVTERKEQEDITSIKEDIVTVGNSPEDEKQQHEDEQLTHEEETKKEEGPERGDSVVKKSSTAQTALKNKEGKITDESGKEQKNEEVETSLIQDKQETSDDEIEESPVVLRRTVRGRHKVSPKPNSRKHSKSYQNQEEHTDQAGLRKGGSAEEKADEQAAEKQKEEHHKVFCESVVIEATIPTVEEAAEDVILSTEMNMEEICKEVQEEKETERETKIVSAADNEEEADGVTGSRTVISDEVRDEGGILGAEGPQDRNIGSEIPKLQKATVILVDFKTTYHHLSVIEAEEKTFDGKCAAPEMEQMELIAAEEKQGSREPEMPMLEEEDQEKQENITENSVDATAEVETVQKEELEENNAEKEKYKSASMDEKQSEAEEAPVLETRVLRSGRKTIDASCKARERSNQQQREDNIGEGTTEKDVLEEEGLEEEVEDLVTIQENTGEGCVEETEAKIVDDEEEELKVTEMRKLRSRKYAAKATSRHKSTSRQKQGKKEKKAASEISEDEPVTHVRALGGEGGSIPVAQRCRTRTQKQLQEEKKGGEGREGSTGVEEREAEEEEEYIEEQHTTQEMEKVEYMGVEKTDTMAEEAVSQDAPEEEQAGTTETVADENTEAPAKQTAEDRKTSYDVAQETVTTQYAVEEEQSITTSKGAETAAAENAQNTLLITKHDEARGVSDQEEASVSETIILRSGEKAVRAKPRGKATKKQDDEVEVEAAGEKSTEEDEPAVETRVLRKGKRSAPATPRNRSKRARTQCQPEETEGVTTPAEESEGEETKADENENNSDEKIEEMDDEEFVPQNESFTEQETPSTNKRNITEQEEAPVVEPRVLRSGHKSADTGKPAETRVQRKGRRTAPATPRLKSKRAHTQCQPEQEAEEVTTPSEETEGEEEVAREESPEEKGERAEEGEKWKEMEVEKKDLEEVQVKSAAGGDSVVDTFTEETAVLENEHNSVAAVNETNTDTLQISTAKVEWTNSAEEEESAVIEKSTAATEVGSDTTTAEEEALTEDAYAVTQEEAPVIARALRSKTKTPHATPSGGLKRQKDQGVVDSQQQEDENPEDEKTQEDLHLLTDDIVECREINVMEQAEANETLSTGEETMPLVEDTAEHQAKEKVDLIYNRGLEPKEMESPEESSSGESKEDKTVDPSVEGRNLRRRKKTTNKDGDKVEEIQLPKRRSIRKRPRIDYRENDEEEEGGETEAATDREEEEEVDEDEDEDNRKAECSANEQVEKLEEDNKNENLEKDMGAIESTSEKGDILNLVLDTDEEVETEALSQEHEEDEQNISEEEVEPIVIDKRVLRGRSVPSLIITPHSKPRRHSAKVRKSEESLSDEEKSPQSAQKRSVHKRKSTEVPPTRKAKRHSRV